MRSFTGYSTREAIYLTCQWTPHPEVTDEDIDENRRSLSDDHAHVRKCQIDNEHVCLKYLSSHLVRKLRKKYALLTGDLRLLTHRKM